jgi:hypothetical protein
MYAKQKPTADKPRELSRGSDVANAGREKATREGYVGQAAIPPERFDSR